jgi:hypothetical protein
LGQFGKAGTGFREGLVVKTFDLFDDLALVPPLVAEEEEAIVVVEVDGGMVGFVDFQPLFQRTLNALTLKNLINAAAEEDDAFFGFEAVNDLFPILVNAGSRNGFRHDLPGFIEV